MSLLQVVLVRCNVSHEFIIIILNSENIQHIFIKFKQVQNLVRLLYDSDILTDFLHITRAFDWPLLVFTSSTQINVYCGSSFKAELCPNKHSNKIPGSLNKAVKLQICYSHALKYIWLTNLKKLRDSPKETGFLLQLLKLGVKQLLEAHHKQISSATASCYYETLWILSNSS